MDNNEPIYITGHQHPDTDSVASAIAYAFFKRCQGIKAIPCRLGELNNETSYLLKRFGFEKPMLLKDARKTLGEIELDAPDYITPETTVFETIRKMRETERAGFAVLNGDKTVAGYVSRSDLTNIGLGDTAAEIELLKHTSVAHIAEAISGTILYDDKQLHLNGKASIVAHSQNGVDNYDVLDRIVIIGDDPEAQKKLIEKGAGMLIVVWADAVEQSVLDEAKIHHCPVLKSGHGTMNTSRYLFLAPPVRLIMKTKPMMFHDDDFAEDAGKKMMKTRYHNFPVIDRENHLVGYVGRYHILNYRNKKIVLVDHNEFSQSVNAIEKAQILEVVDHHRINDFATSQPVSFRNEIVGSTATIISTMFRENQIPIPKNLAGLLLGAVLSDTLIFQSPTTTQKDRDIANILAALADLDIDTFAKEMFSATASSASASIHEMIVQDIKYYDIEGCRTMISQVIVNDLDKIRSRSKEIQQDMNLLVKKKNLDLLVTAFTSIIDDGSIFYSAGEQAEKCQEAYPDGAGKKPSLQKGVLSRKSQILPQLTKEVEN